MHVMLTGTTGFIGSRVVSELRRRQATVTALVRQNIRIPGVRTIAGDLGNAALLGEAASGVDVVIHAASYIGYDPEVCQRVNIAGTGDLLSAAAPGVPVIYVSTAAVYGSGQPNGLSPDELAISPESTLSQSRAAAESMVLASGGSVVRPNFVYGAGDRWFIPGLRKCATALDRIPNGGDALVSVIHVRELARFIVDLAESPAPGAFHAVNPEPVRIGTLSSRFEPLPTLTFSPSDHQLRMLTEDNWYRPAERPTIPEKGFYLTSEDESFYANL